MVTKSKLETASTFLLIFLLGVFGGLKFGMDVKQESLPNNGMRVDTVTVETNTAVDHRSAEWMARAIYSERKLMSHFEYNAWVIRNRLESEQYPNTVRGVVLQDSQFSAFNTRKKRNELEALSYPESKSTLFRRAYRMSRYVLSASSKDNPMPMVTHFYHEETMEQKYGKSAPDWASHGDLFYSHGQARYYKNVQAPTLSSTSTTR